MVPKQIISHIALVGVAGIAFSGAFKLGQKVFRNLTHRNAGKSGEAEAVKMVPQDPEGYSSGTDKV